MIRRTKAWVKRLFVDTTVELVELRRLREEVEMQIERTLEAAHLNSDDDYWRKIHDDMEQGRYCGIDKRDKAS